MENQQITITNIINAPIEKVWEYYNTPKHIMKWNHASDDWHSPSAENDLRVGGRFAFRMEAKDGSDGFDFSGTYTELEPNKALAYRMDDGRDARITFDSHENSTKVSVNFDPESENSRELQQQGWQAILDNFKVYVETN